MSNPAVPAGIDAGEIIGVGAAGTVRRGRITDVAMKLDAPAWAKNDVAIKTWEDLGCGAAVAAAAVAAIKAVPAAAMLKLVCDNTIMPAAVVEGTARAVIMPLGVAVSNRDWRHVLAAVEKLADSPTRVVHMDVKAANLMWHNGHVKFVDHDALFSATGTQLPALPSYAPWIWRRWVPDMDVPATRNVNPEAYDDAYYTAYDLISTALSRDRDGVLAVMYWGALATAITMTTGHGNPFVSAAAVSDLECPMATRLFQKFTMHWENSAIATETDKLGAKRHENSG